MDLNEVEITPARETELELLSRLAIRAKSYWGYSAAQVQEWAPELTLTPESVASQEVFVARDSDQALGFYALELRERVASVEHFWVEPRFMGIGLGRLLLRHAQQVARLHGCEVLEIDSDPNAEEFYRKMGAERVGLVAAPVPGDADRTRPQMILGVRRRED